MYWDVLEVKNVAPRTLEVVFSDGMKGQIFIDSSFCSGVFEVLNDDDEIAKAFVENGVVTWQSGLDLAPDTMYREIKNRSNHFYKIEKNLSGNEK